MSKITDIIIPFKTPLKIPPIIHPSSSLSIKIKTGQAEIYKHGSQKIKVPIWGYRGKYPGPMIEMERDDTVKVSWKNQISQDELLPCKAEEVSFPNHDGATPQNVLDNDQANNSLVTPPSKAFLSVHLHGGKSIPGSDGWPESMLLPKDPESDDYQLTLCRYENKQRAMMLWYHDHAMHTTRLNNFVGLAGLWMIRDEEEASLDIPEEDYELPLVIQDRNLTDFTGFTTEDEVQAKFLHRIEAGGPLEFFGPLTLVNGRIWPRKRADPTAYRLRILNGSNSRFYRLHFAEKLADGSYKWITLPVKQIGTDCGLLSGPVNLPDNGLTIAPAERVDVIVDFSGCYGKDIVLLNSAEAPFANDPPKHLDDPNAMFPADPDTHIEDGEPWRTPYPEVMMFSVENQKQCEADTDLYDFDQLAMQMLTLVESYQSEDPIPRLPADPIERTVVLVEKTEVHQDMDGNDVEKVVLVEWELAKKDEVPSSSTVPLILQSQREVIIDGVPFVVTAERFQDPVNWIVRLNDTEKWRFINLTADTHPMHVHLVQFKAVARKVIALDTAAASGNGCVDPDNDVVVLVDCLSANGSPVEINITPTTDAEAINALDGNEKGFKDTIRVNPGEMVEIVATFEGYCGRYVYHCHLLEHEDHDILRQFIVARDDMAPMHHSPISVGKK